MQTMQMRGLTGSRVGPRAARGGLTTSVPRPLVCFSSEASNGTVATSAPSSSSEPDKKLQSTLSSLDALLPTPAKPAASTSQPQASAPPKPKAQPQPATLPSLPSSSSDNTVGAAARRPQQQQLRFDQVMGFSGVAPEIINGRAAMLGFIVALANELRNGESVFAQMVSGGAAQMLIVIVAVTAASFAPAARSVPWDKMFGKDKTPEEFGPFTPNAELINGRAAMLGLAAILFFEGAGNSAFFM